MTVQQPLEKPGSRGSGVPARARRPDYRLRGLNLEARGRSEVPARVVRRKHPGRGRQRRRLLLQWGLALMMATATAVGLRVYVVTPYAVRSTAMVPNIRPGTSVLVVRPRLLTGSIHVGDIVVLHRTGQFNCSDAGGNSQDLVKRVIGLPGQTIRSVAERVYVNGQPLEEPLSWYNPPFGELGFTSIARTVIPSGSYFVMGDNRADPCDSRSFGPISGSSVVGKAVATTARNSHPFVHIL